MCNRISSIAGVAAAYCILLAAWPGGGVAAAGAPPPAAAFARLPDLSMVRLTPDGKVVAWVGYRDGQRLVSIYDVDARRYLRNIQPDKALKLRDLTWADNRTLLMTLSQTHTESRNPRSRRKYEFSRIFAVNSDGGPARILLMDDSARQWVTSAQLLRAQTGRPETVIMSSWDYLHSAHNEEIGSRLAYGRKDEGWLHSLFEVNTRTGTGKRLAAGTPFTMQWIVDGDGHPVARSEWNAAKHDFRVFANHNGGWKQLYAAEKPDELHPEALAADRQALIALGARGGSRIRAWRMPLDGSEISLLFEGDEDVQFIVEDRFSGAPAGLSLGGLEPTVHWLDPKLQATQATLGRTFSNKTVHIYNHSQDYSRVLARVEGARSPPVYYLIDLTKGTADTVGEAYPELRRAALGTHRAIRYQARDGVTIPAYLTLPPAREPTGLPLIVLPHGGPQGRDDSGFDWWAQFIATRGYAVLQPQFRGSTGFGADLQRAGTREWGRAMQDDIGDGVQHLIDQQVVDGSRVCIVGTSYGGYAALAGAAFTPDQFACAASINGITNLPGMLGYIKQRQGDESNTLAAWQELVGLPYQDQLDSTSPAHSVRSIRIPILLIHGTDDVVVPYSQSEGFARLLRQHGKPHTLIKLKGEDHWLSTGEARVQAMQALEAFLAEHLQDKMP